MIYIFLLQMNFLSLSLSLFYSKKNKT